MRGVVITAELLVEDCHCFLGLILSNFRNNPAAFGSRFATRAAVGTKNILSGLCL
jgi:hypothetical protein